MVGYGILGTILAWQFPNEHMGWILVNVFLFYLFTVAVIVPHELGHAFAGQWVGFRIIKIIIGVGKPIWKGKLFGFDTEIGTVPLGGFAFGAPRVVEGYRRKLLAFVAAGPATNLLLLLLILPAVQDHKLWTMHPLNQSISPAPVFFYANLWVLICNLLPFSVNHAFGRFPTDGKQILSLPFMKPEAAAQAHAGYFAVEGAEAHRKGQLQEAHEWFERGLSLYPDNENLVVGKGLWLIAQEDFTAAREAFCALLERSPQKPAFRTIMLNNIAWCDVMMNDPSLLDEADRFSKEAMAMAGGMAFIKDTRGTVLVALGRFEEAVPLLKEAMLEHEGSRKTDCACWIAIAEAERGNRTEAERYIQEARKAEPKPKSLARAERALAQTQ